MHTTRDPYFDFMGSFTKNLRYFLNTAILILSQIQIFLMKLLIPSHTMYMSYKTIVST